MKQLAFEAELLRIVQSCDVDTIPLSSAFSKQFGLLKNGGDDELGITYNYVIINQKPTIRNGYW